MESLRNFQMMCRYNLWMNEKIYAVCAAIPDAERKEDKGAFFRSIHGTLNHLLLADRIWLGRFTGVPFSEARSLDQELYADFDELRAERARTDADIATWLEGLAPEQIEAPLTWMPMTSPQQQTMPLWFVLLHLFNHQTHHRGQLTTLLEQSGYDSGPTDLLLLPGAGELFTGPQDQPPGEARK